MARAVRFDEYGGVEVLQVVEVEPPTPGPDEVRVRVAAASINPGEAKIRAGLLHERWPSTFPSGEGSDFAGVVDALGAGVDGVAVGDEVIGYTDDRASHADYVVVPADHLTAKPEPVSWPVAGSLFVAGATAYAAVRALDLTDRDTVVVSAAAGGVGAIAVQLAVRTGARVVGVAGAANHEWLRAHGVVPVEHSGGVIEGIREAAGGPVDAFLDLYGHGYVEMALELGVAPERINTIVDFPAVEAHGVISVGNAAGASREVLAELASMVADGSLEVPVAATYPLDRVQDAFRELERGHTRGKIVLLAS
jgi:NADPH:quinone reductase-like Zn-dependent oxidoreductase